MDTNTLHTLIRTYASHQAISDVTAAKRAGAHTRLATRLAAGHGCTLKTANRVVAWFDTHWPKDLEWPQGVPRPSRQRRSAA